MDTLQGQTQQDQGLQGGHSQASQLLSLAGDSPPWLTKIIPQLQRGAHSPQGCPWNAQVGGPGRPQRWALRTLLHKATLPRPGRSSSTYPTEANTGQRPEPGDKETGPSARRAPTSQKITKRMETSNRPGAEVRTLVIKMLRDLRGEKSFV